MAAPLKGGLALEDDAWVLGAWVKKNWRGGAAATWNCQCRCGAPIGLGRASPRVARSALEGLGPGVRILSATPLCSPVGVRVHALAELGTHGALSSGLGSAEGELGHD